MRLHYRNAYASATIQRDMVKVKDCLLRFAHFLGFRRNSEYVKEHLNTSNVRTTITMASIIAAIEVWMIIRQTTKYYIPRVQEGRIEAGFANFWSYTSNFWLFLFISLSIICFAIGKLYIKNQKFRFILNMTFGVLSLATALMVIYLSHIGTFANWNGHKYIYTNFFTLLIYGLGALYGFSVIFYSCIAYFKKIEDLFLCQTIVSLFGIACLVFGIMVSFSDYLGTVRVNGVDVLQNKQIICFLTMIVYCGVLVVYRPIVSFTLLGTAFYVFYKLLLSVDSIRVLPDGDKVNYLTFVLMLIVVVSAMYSQRLNDAIKSESLEYKAKYDDMTGLYNFDHFLAIVKDEMPSKESAKKAFLFCDLDDFKAYNDRRGFASGNELIRKVGEILSDEFGKENVAHVFADHFVAFVDQDGFMEKVEDVRTKTMAIDPEIAVHMKCGGYRFRIPDEDPRRAFDKARYACALCKGKDDLHFVEYDDELHRAYHLHRHIVHDLDEAIEQGYIKPYYQPVVWSEDGTLAGCEALCRWIDPRYGFISPGTFVPALEGTRQIQKLDAAILEAVCRDIHESLENGRPIVPISINFSRLDFELMDPIAVLEGLVKKYNVPKEYLHVEITESALSGDIKSLADSIQHLRDLGYAIWLDDFGSGYSSFNALKEFRFDVLKIDMQFLSNFATNKNSGVLIETIINMCERIGMKTLTEGVETEEEINFLRSVGCGRLQGYFFGKAMPLEELQQKIAEGTFVVTDHFE